MMTILFLSELNANFAHNRYFPYLHNSTDLVVLILIELELTALFSLGTY